MAQVVANAIRVFTMDDSAAAGQLGSGRASRRLGLVYGQRPSMLGVGRLVGSGLVGRLADQSVTIQDPTMTWKRAWSAMVSTST